MSFLSNTKLTIVLLVDIMSSFAMSFCFSIGAFKTQKVSCLCAWVTTTEGHSLCVVVLVAVA